MARTAAALIIGNEILTGKIQEKNLSYLGQELFSMGIALRRAIICPDEIDIIVEDLNSLRQTYDLIFTSGGVGPTHDDITMAAIAKAFDRALVRSPEIEQMIRDYYKSRLTESHLRMADMPEGARLISNDEIRLPTVAIENVYIFPGVPELFRMKFPVLREILRESVKFITRAVHIMSDEGEIADTIGKIASQHSEVAIGSYPQWNKPQYRVKVTFDGHNPETVQRAVQALLKELPTEKIVSIED
ncbi:MAG: competence/damage-inducible protein A [Proteobacteria bacterium]|nr:competence/damage-inducible protein A [Pseudomonadota bacterium]